MNEIWYEEPCPEDMTGNVLTFCGNGEIIEQKASDVKAETRFLSWIAWKEI